MSSEIYVTKLEEVSAGIAPGVHPTRPGLWQDARNVNFEVFGAVTQRGRRVPTIQTLTFDDASGDFDSGTGFFDDALGAYGQLVTGMNTRINGMHLMTKNNGNRLLFFADKNQIKLYDGASATVAGENYTGSDDAAGPYSATLWSMANWGDWVIATNGIDRPQLWKGTEPSPVFEDMDDASMPLTAEIVFKLGPYIHFAKVANGRNTIVRSQEGNPEVIEGSLPLNDLETDIVACVPLGQSYGIYTANEMQIYSYIGNIFSFGALPGVTGIGAISKFSVVSDGPKNWGLMMRGIFVTDGINTKWVSDPALGEWMRKNINKEQMSKVVGYLDRDNTMVKWSIPTVGSNNNSIVIGYNYQTGAITFNSMPFTIAAEAGVFNYPVVGLSGGQVYQENFGYDDNGNALTRYLQTKPLDLGKRNNWKHISHVATEIVVTSGSGPKLEVGIQENLDDTIVWHGPFDVNEKQKITPLAEDGVFFTFKWSSRAADDHWELSGFRLLGEIAGEVN